jgi:hypothetical protein
MGCADCLAGDAPVPYWLDSGAGCMHTFRTRHGWRYMGCHLRSDDCLAGVAPYRTGWTLVQAACKSHGWRWMVCVGHLARVAAAADAQHSSVAATLLVAAQHAVFMLLDGYAVVFNAAMQRD